MLVCLFLLEKQNQYINNKQINVCDIVSKLLSQHFRSAEVLHFIRLNIQETQTAELVLLDTDIKVFHNTDNLINPSNTIV